MQKFADIRNIAIIAHVDHGKTTLVDGMLKETKTFRENEEAFTQSTIMDSNELEREKGITILAKNTAVFYKSVKEHQSIKINIIDTPGHADFGGEVERVLSMADGAVLIVDAAEGPLPQTTFVLKLALQLNLKIILIINKIDKKLARPEEVLAQTEALFLHLAKDPSHLEFKTLFAVGRDAKVFYELPKNYSAATKGDLSPLFETIIKEIPSPIKDREKPFQMLISTLDYDPYLGRLGIGRIHRGKITKGEAVVIVDEGKKIPVRVEKLFTSIGIKKEEVELAEAGDIVSLAIKANLNINQTICAPAFPQALPTVKISPPTMKITIGANTSPFAGREGKFVTNRQIQERLIKEKQTNIGLEIEPDPASSKFIVKGRGELHLAVLIEKLRREGYEMEISKPQVIFKEVNGQTLEPFTEVNIEVPDEFVGVITQEMGKRKGELQDMKTLGNGLTRFVYKISERNMIGARSIFLSATKGTINLSTLFLDYFPIADTAQRLRNGVILSAITGKAVAYGLQTVCERGTLFIPAQTEVYEGMIVGLNAKEDDMEVNVNKGKKLTNMHTESSDQAIVLTPPVIFSLEQSLDFLADDELLEATPGSLRLRKKHLSHVDRVRAERGQKN